MSSIIDALKKSDQNRNNDHQADINNIQFSDSPPPNSRKGFWLLVIVLLLIAVGVYAWQQGWHHQLLNYLGSGTTDEVTTEQKTTQGITTKAVPDEKMATTENSQKKPVGNQLIPPKQSEIKAKTEQLLNNKKAQTQADETITPVTKETETIKPLEKTLDGNNQQKLIQANSGKSDGADEKIIPVNVQVNADESNQAKKSLEPSLKQDYLLLHQIDFAIRKNIPPVKLNIHIYDPEPENRMVLINGERFNIGDSIGDILTVTDIVKEGIVVSFENIEFLIPK